MSDEGPLLPQLAANPKMFSQIKRTASLALIMKKYNANPCVNRTGNGAATAASVKHKCYSYNYYVLP